MQTQTNSTQNVFSNHLVQKKNGTHVVSYLDSDVGKDAPDSTDLQCRLRFLHRHCPGSHLVESSIWLLIASLLSTFSIRAPQGPDGKPVVQNVVFDHLVFRCARCLPGLCFSYSRSVSQEYESD